MSLQSRFSSWKIKHLIAVHLLAIALIASVFYAPVYEILWKGLDEACYRALSASVLNSPFLQDFWAVANHRIGDAIEDVFFVLFFLWLIKITPRGEKLKKAAEFFFLALLTTAVILLISNFLFKQVISVKRLSPSLILDSFPKLADLVSWIRVKGGSKASFPSDHATTAVMFVLNFLLLTKNRLLQVSVCLYGAFLCCPRMVAGAHWLTDILCGSTAIVIIIYSWALYTPFASFCIDKLYKFFLWSAKAFKPALARK